MKRATTLAMLALTLVACDDSTATVPVIESTTAVSGFFYLDVDGSETLTGVDVPLQGGIVILTAPGTDQVLGADTSLAGGEYVIDGVEVGTVEISVSPDFLADSLLQVPLDTAQFSLRADEQRRQDMGVTFPQRSVLEARAEDTGITIFTQGVVVNSRGQAPGGAIHVEGPDATIRVIVPPAVQGLVGDSVRVRGRTGVDLDQPALLDGRLYGLVPGARDVDPRVVRLAEAGSADGGSLDAALVEVTQGTVVAQDTIPEGFLLTLEEGSDSLEVRLRREQGFGALPNEIGAPVIQLVGLLIPVPADGTWQLVPRNPLDYVLGPPPPPDPDPTP